MTFAEREEEAGSPLLWLTVWLLMPVVAPFMWLWQKWDERPRERRAMSRRVLDRMHGRLDRRRRSAE